MATRKKGDFLSQAKSAGHQEKVDVQGVDMDVYACTLSRAQVRQITESCLRPGKKMTDADGYDEDKLTQRIVAASIVDAKGVRLVPEGREHELDDLPNPVQMALQVAAFRVNGMGGAGND